MRGAAIGQRRISSGMADSPRFRASRMATGGSCCREPLLLRPACRSIFAERKARKFVSREVQVATNVARVASIAGLCALASCGGWARTATAQTALSIEVLSSRPDLVTGGDALVRISGPEAPKVTVDASDVSAEFRPDQNGRWVGLIEGLKDGANQLVAKAGGKEATVTLVNHPLNGTLFAGPQQEPFICENQSHGLASSADSSCAAPAVVKYFFRNKSGDWKPLDPKGSRPADIAITKTTEGREVPLIIRHRHGAQFSAWP
jgi:hypothetical protein